jgi:hypothetical protein
MSIYATVGESEPAFFSSSQGWRDVTAWADALDAIQFDEVVHMVEHGFTNDAGKLSEQLQAAVAVSPPPVDVSDTIGELIELLRGESGEVIIDSGLEESDSDGT